MPESISDTGPILHLHEIDRLPALSTVEPLTLPDLVAAELTARGLEAPILAQKGVTFRVSPVAANQWQEAVEAAEPYRIQPADAQVFVLARTSNFRNLVLTDDLSLRRLLEASGGTVAGTFGILVRAYASGTLERNELEAAVDDLFHESSLHLSRAFRSYLRSLLQDLP